MREATSPAQTALGRCRFSLAALVNGSRGSELLDASRGTNDTVRAASPAAPASGSGATLAQVSWLCVLSAKSTLGKLIAALGMLRTLPCNVPQSTLLRQKPGGMLHLRGKI